MLKRVLSIGLVLACTSMARAGVEVRLDYSPSETPFSGGEQFRVDVWVTSDTTISARSLQVDHLGPLTSAALMLGQDIDNVNNGFDGVENFWFDYTSLTGGTFPSEGLIERTLESTTGGYADFSNLRAGPSLNAVPASTLWASSEAGEQIVLQAGVSMRIGGMWVTLPTILGDYTLDLLNAAATDMNDGFRIDFNFDDPQTWSAVGGENAQIVYGDGGGPLTFSVVPEPATLLLLTFGGLAAWRRRSAA